MLSNVCIFVVWDLRAREGMLQQIMAEFCLFSVSILVREGDQTGNFA